MREENVRDRTNVNIVTLGASQHGKTLLCSRLTEVLSVHGVPVKKVDWIRFWSVLCSMHVQRCLILTIWRQKKRVESLSPPPICSFGAMTLNWYLGQGYKYDFFLIFKLVRN